MLEAMKINKVLNLPQLLSGKWEVVFSDRVIEITLYNEMIKRASTLNPLLANLSEKLS